MGNLFQTLLGDAEHVLESELPAPAELRGMFTALVHRLEAEVPSLAERAFTDVLDTIGAEPPARPPAEQVASPTAVTAAGASSPAAPAAVAGDGTTIVAEPPASPSTSPAPAPVPGATIAAADEPNLITPETDAAAAQAAAPAQPDPVLEPIGSPSSSSEGEDKSLSELDAELRDAEQRVAQLQTQRANAAQAGIAVSTDPAAPADAGEPPIATESPADAAAAAAAAKGASS